MVLGTDLGWIDEAPVLGKALVVPHGAIGVNRQGTAPRIV